MSSFKNCIFVFLRHGDANQNNNDLLRELTQKGINQVLNFRKNHGDFDIFISSPAKRAVQTTQIIMNTNKDEDIIKLDILYSLPNHKESNILIDMLKRNGPLSLKDYYRIEKEKNFDLLMKIGIEGTNKLGEVLYSVNRQKILIVAHSVTIQSLVFSMFSTSEVVRNIALNETLSECQAFKIVTDNEGKVSSAYIIS